jgi:hypothetical protein
MSRLIVRDPRGSRKPTAVEARETARGFTRWPLLSLSAEARALPDAALAEQAADLAALPPAFWVIAWPRLSILAVELARRLAEREVAA